MHTHLPTRSAWSRAWLWTLSASLAWPAHAAPLVFSQLPPASAIPPPPNVIVTLDDSGSMGAGVIFVPGQAYPIPPGPDGTPLRAELPPPPTTGGTVTAQAYTNGYAGSSTNNIAIPASVPVEARAAYVRWYGFYRNRNMAMKASVLSTFNRQVIPDGKVRLAWQGLSATCAGGFTTGGCANSMWPLSDSEGGRKHRTNFFNWVMSVPAGGGTPLGAAYERAGQYLMTTGLNSPYAHRPGSTQLPEISCRRSYQVMFTDGVGSGWPGEQDNLSRVLPDGTPYVPRGPYAHNWAGTLSDVAFRYWATDLQTGPNFQNDISPLLRVPGTQRYGKEEVRPYWNPNNNPASWQHLVTYAIAFGEAANITDPQWAGSTTAGPQFAQLVDGTRQWPFSAAPDLWHAAVNSRGAMYLATDQAAVTAAFKSVMDEIASQNVSSGGAASSFSLDGANFRTVRAGYTSAPNLRGTLSGFGLGANGLIESTPKWEGNAELSKVAHDKRTVLTAAGPTGGVPFRWANLSTWQKGELDKSMAGKADGQGSPRLDYLRGDTSKELVVDPSQPSTPVGPPWVFPSMAGPQPGATTLALSSANVTGGALYPDNLMRPGPQRPDGPDRGYFTSGNWLGVAGSTANLVLPDGVSAFGFLWGTPDTPNTVKVNTNLGSQTWTAEDIARLTGRYSLTGPDPFNGNTYPYGFELTFRSDRAEYVKFEAAPGVSINSVEFSSTLDRPFEISNVWTGSRSGFLPLTRANVSGGALYSDMWARSDGNTGAAERPVSLDSNLSTVGTWLATHGGMGPEWTKARLTLPSGTRSLSFLWGTPDTFNTITVNTSAGSQSLSPTALYPGPFQTYGTATAVNYSVSNPSATITSVDFAAGSLYGNIEVSNVTVSPSLSLGTGFRWRQGGLLGTIVNAEPKLVGAPRAGYTNADYVAFRKANLNRTPVAYVGANDGMLHGFNALTGAPMLSYVPRGLYPNLSAYTDPTFIHRMYVDGPLITADWYDGTAWRTLLVGGLGAGGRGLFALDITDPGKFSEGNAGSLVRFDYTAPPVAQTSAAFLSESGSSGMMAELATDLGHISTDPARDAYIGRNLQVARMRNGKWALIVGNGVNSVNERAVLYVIFLDGSGFRKIVTDSTMGQSNGLATPLPVDVNADGLVDFVYAGDMLGRLWKFDLTSTNDASWKVVQASGVNTPLIDTGRPITSAPAVANHPNGGLLVTFGTGRSLTDADRAGATPEALYGVWDKPGVAFAKVSTSDLVERTLSADSATTAGGNTLARVLASTSSPVDYGSKRGWRISLGAPKERVVFNPIVQGRLAYFSTYIPATSTSCSIRESGALLAFDVIDGGQPTTPVIDINGDGLFEKADRIPGKDVMGRTAGIGRLMGLFEAPAGSAAASTCSGDTIMGAEGLICAKRSPGPGRRAWRDMRP